ncbi:MAG: universal stress protein [Flavobacteriaceae bacterium]|nr:universal stress protein [Flavobacteriaceae bacterium]
MKNILVPLGPSDNAKASLQYAADFASDFGANLFVMRSFSLKAKTGSLANIEQKVTENAKAYLTSVVKSIDSKGVDIKIVTYKGDVVSAIKNFDKELQLDLVMMAARSNDVHEEYYLGNTTGKIIKQTNAPTLVIPMGAMYKPAKRILVAFKSGVLKRNSILDPLRAMGQHFHAAMSLLLVKTPGYTDADLQINPGLMDLSQDVSITENTNTYHGVLEYFKEKDPEMLCVFRRKRGFFKKLWEKNHILKKEFYVPVPVLVLSVKKD